MGFVGDMFDSSKGAGFRGSSAPLQKAVTDQQVSQAYDNTQSGLTQQQAFVNALQGQNGIQNQSNVYNQLGNIAQGAGPNPAQAMLAQATGANTANQAALMASQRGSSQNVGLMARQAAAQGGANQQNAAGQAAVMQANQSLGALGQMGALASQQVGQQQTGLSNYNQFAQGQQQNLLNAVAQYNSANVGMQSNVNNVNAAMAQGNQKFQQDQFTKALGATGTAAMPAGAHGGMVQGYAEGGVVGGSGLLGLAQKGLGSLFSSGTPQAPLNDPYSTQINPQSTQPMSETARNMNSPSTGGSGLLGLASKGLGSLFSSNKVSQPNENAIDETHIQMAQGGMPQNMKTGGRVPGQASVAGDSYANDTVPAILSPKEIVIPRSITMGQNAGEMAKQFVENELKKQSFAEGGTAQPTININVPQAGAQPQSPPIPSPPAKQPPQTPVIAQNEPQAPQGMAPPAVTQPAVNEEKQAPQGPQNYQIPQQQDQVLPTVSAGEDELQAGVQKQMQGIEQEAQAKGQIGKEQAQAAQGFIQQQQEQQKIAQDQFQAHLKEVDNVAQDYKNGHINPNRVYENMSTFGKVRTAIGLILGGLGSQNGVNPAMQFLQSQIDRDIESQKQDLDKNNNLLSVNLKKFGNLQDAQNMTRAQQLAIYSAQLQQAAGKTQNQVEQARALQAAGQLQAQIAPQLQQMRMQNQVASLSQEELKSSKNLATAARFLAPQDMKKDALKEVGEYQAMVKAQEKVRNAFDKLEKINTIGNRVKHLGFTPASVSALINPITAGLSKETAGKFSEFEAQALSHLFPSPGDTAETIADKRDQVEKMIAEKMNFPTLNSIGIHAGPKEYANKNSNVAPSYKTAKR